MSYLYRKERRNCAHWLLKILSNNLSTDPNAQFIEYSNQGLNKIHNSTPGAIWNRFKQFTPYQIYDALILLKENGDILFDESEVDYLNAKIVCTPKGRITCKSGYYKTENKKDFIQNVELRTKWIFIFIPIIISIISLAISTLNFFYPHK